ncbi:MAG: metal-dependent hydrolase [Planctomycetales bacterium]
MANYQTHITVSGLLGAGYGLTASFVGGFDGVQGALAGCLTGIAGMLPDLDSDSGRPVREVFGLLAAVAPLVMLSRLEAWGGSRDAALLLAVLLYVAIRFGAATLLNLVAVHRGMFHSVPALMIAAEITYLAYACEQSTVRLLMAVGVALGFASHLILDELYSVKWNGATLQLKASAGSAIKWIGKDWRSNIVAYGILFTFSYAILVDGSGRLPSPAGVQDPSVQVAQPVDSVKSPRSPRRR